MKNLRNSLSNVLVMVGLFVILTACDSAKVYQDFTDFEEAFWHQDNPVTFEFEIVDTSINYNLQALFRNSLAYPYHNMYYKYKLIDPLDSVLSEELMQVYLFDPKSGEPNGSGVGDMFDQKHTIFEGFKFSESGTYKVELQQAMRLDTLPFILSVGWRVEKSEVD